MSSREDVALSCAVPIEWVPDNHADMTEDDLVSAIEDARDRALKTPCRKSTAKRDISKMREVDTYGDYLIGICASPLLRLRDGGQAVHLERRFVGATLSHDGSRWQRHGVQGQADLCGGLVVDLAGRGVEVRRRVEVRLEVEVKTGRGRPTKEQLARQAAFRRRGGLYLIVRSIDDAVAQIVAERDRIAGIVG